MCSIEHARTHARTAAIDSQPAGARATIYMYLSIGSLHSTYMALLCVPTSACGESEGGREGSSQLLHPPPWPPPPSISIDVRVRAVL